MEKQRHEESERRRKEVRRSEKRKSEKKEDAGARKGRKVAIHCVFFRWFVAPESRKVGSLKRRARSHVVRWEMKSCTPLWREARLEVKTAHVRSTFKFCDVEKVRAVVARSTFPSQNVQSTRTTFGSWDVEKGHTIVARSTCPGQSVQNTPTSEQFLKSRCSKSMRCCGAKHISKSKCTKHTNLRAVFEVQMFKKYAPLWREAHFQVKMYKTHQPQSSFWSSDVQKVCAVVARSTFPSQNAQNTTCSDHFLTFRCRFAWQVQGIARLVKSEQIVRVLQYSTLTLRYATLYYTSPVQHYNPVQYTTLNSITLHYATTTTATATATTLHYTTLHKLQLHINYNYNYNYNCNYNYNYNYTITTTTAAATTTTTTAARTTTTNTVRFTTLR